MATLGTLDIIRIILSVFTSYAYLHKLGMYPQLFYDSMACQILTKYSGLLDECIMSRTGHGRGNHRRRKTSCRWQYLSSSHPEFRSSRVTSTPCRVKVLEYSKIPSRLVPRSSISQNFRPWVVIYIHILQAKSKNKNLRT